MSETMGFSPLSSPLFPPPAPFPATPRLVPSYIPCSGLARAVSRAVSRATSAVTASLRSTSPLPCQPPPGSRRPKFRALAPLSPALYHVLPRTSPFSNINIYSAFPPHPTCYSAFPTPPKRSHPPRPTPRLSRLASLCLAFPRYVPRPERQARREPRPGRDASRKELVFPLTESSRPSQ
jgi:hypothetical protein